MWTPPKSLLLLVSLILSYLSAIFSVINYTPSPIPPPLLHHLYHSPSSTSQFQYTHPLWQHHSTHLVTFVELRECVVSASVQSLHGDVALGAMTAFLSIRIQSQKACAAWTLLTFGHFFRLDSMANSIRVH